MNRVIIFEGIDGCGKSTQAGILRSDLNARGFVAEVFKPNATGLKYYITNDDFETTDLAYMLARSYMINQEVIPHLDEGPAHIAIIDRFVMSHLVYVQSEINDDLISRITYPFEKLEFDPLTIILDLEPETAFLRSTKDIFWETNLEDYVYRQERYNQLASQRDNVVQLHVSPKEDRFDVHRRILKEVLFESEVQLL